VHEPPRCRAAALVAALAAAFLLAQSAGGAEIASGDLQIQGASLAVVDVAVTTGVDIPVSIQTEFGGRRNEAAPVVEGMFALGELTGPGIETPITLETAPGSAFRIPGLQREGTYFLQNIRLSKDGSFLQSASPAVATITVANVFSTRVRVRQLTIEEIRARGIAIDARNFEVFADLSRLDERFGPDGELLPPDQLFETAALSVTANSFDPRIIWKSEPGVASGALAPVIDPATGMVFAGQVQTRNASAIAALDPIMRVLADTGSGGSESVSTVPLAVAPAPSEVGHKFQK
jgi:hypothetical protein